MDDLLSSPLHAKDSEELEVISGLLHDESFDLDGIQFNKENGIVTIPARRQFHSGPERLIEKGLMGKTFEKEWMRTLITIRGVRSWETQDDQGINSYSFTTWSYSGGVLEMECNEALILRFHVDRCDVEVMDQGFKGKARIKRGLGGMETSSSRVYE